MQSVNLSLNPTYYCNFRCGFCYLTEEQLSSKKLLDLTVLRKRLDEILASGRRIGHVDLYGGEVTLLPFEYLNCIKKVLHHYGVEDIEIITNLSTYKEATVEDEDFGLSVSYDFEYRQQHEHVWKNMLKLPRPFTVLTLGIPEIVKQDPAELIERLNLLSNCHHWEIKPYSPNQANQLDVSYSDYETFVRKVIEYPNKNFEFLNEVALQMAMHRDANPFSDDHVYITPSGNFGVLEFDKNDNEFFLEVNSFQEYLDWTVLEKSRVAANPICGTCDYYGACISEHLREVKSIDESCNGFYQLIKWYGTKHESDSTMEYQHR